MKQNANLATLFNSQEKMEGGWPKLWDGIWQTHKCAFKVRSTCTIQEQQQLMQIETKMLHGLNCKRNTFTFSPWSKLGRKSSLSSLHYNLKKWWGLHWNWKINSIGRESCYFVSSCFFHMDSYLKSLNGDIITLEKTFPMSHHALHLKVIWSFVVCFNG